MLVTPATPSQVSVPAASAPLLDNGAALRKTSQFQSLYESVSLLQAPEDGATADATGQENHADTEPAEHLAPDQRANATPVPAVTRHFSKLPVSGSSQEMNVAVAIASVQIPPPVVFPTNNVQLNARASGKTASMSAPPSPGPALAPPQAVAEAADLVRSSRTTAPPQVIPEAANIAQRSTAIVRQSGSQQSDSAGESSSDVATATRAIAPARNASNGVSAPTGQAIDLAVGAKSTVLSTPQQTTSTAARPVTITPLLARRTAASSLTQPGGQITYSETFGQTPVPHRTAQRGTTPIEVAPSSQPVVSNTSSSAVFQVAPPATQASPLSSNPIRQDAGSATERSTSSAIPQRPSQNDFHMPAGTDVASKVADSITPPAQPIPEEHSPGKDPRKDRDQTGLARATSEAGGQSQQAGAQTATAGVENDSEAPAAAPGEQLSTAFLAQSLPNVPFAARAENLAFTLHLEESNSSSASQQTAPQPSSAPSEPRNSPKTESSPATSASPSRDDSGPGEPNVPANSSVLEAIKDSSDPGTAPQVDLRAPATGVSVSQTTDPARSVSSVATHEVLVPQLDAPKTTPATEIQLHLTADDRSSAAIRVTDRGGAVNVLVHASDPDLRSSLRSNLSDLSGQLNTQGWRSQAEKTSITVPRPQGGQDSGSNEKNSSNQQQQSANQERQSPRDRRTNSDAWQDTFEEHVSGVNPTRGGK